MWDQDISVGHWRGFYEKSPVFRYSGALDLRTFRSAAKDGDWRAA